MNFRITFYIKSVSYYKKQGLFRNVIKRLASTGANSFSNNAKVDMLSIENYWKDKIRVDPYDEACTSKKKFYVLAMFPYPSGKLHMGHVRVYTISDSVAHYYRLQGYNVLHPMGWDAFGLPAENAAIERKVDPEEWTKSNIKEMKTQLERMNYCFDWSRELSTCDPKYYRWTQELFLKMYKRGLVYQKESYVNWDPVDGTVLAEEQVSEDNISWRSGAKVEKRLLKQWYIQTTGFCKDLLDSLKNPNLKNWKDVKAIQANWIGECTGTTMNFQLISNIPDYPKTIDLWTEYPEFIEYAKFVVISPDSLMNNHAYCSEVTSDIQMLDAKVLNPFNGEEMPVCVSNRVAFPQYRDNYLGIPAISMDDYAMLEILGLTFERHSIKREEQRLAKREEVLAKAKEWKIGGHSTSPRAKDWLISRQRYWGTPIPLVKCDTCGVQPVPENQLPVLLPKLTFDFSKTPPTLSSVKDWVNTTCPKCGGSATRETDTMDTFVDSSWYYLRYLDPSNTKEMYSNDLINKAYPIDFYIGGKEHATMHLYYARFISHFLHSEGLLPSREPFIQLLTQGMIKGMSYKVADTGEYIKPEDILEENGKVIQKTTGKSVVAEWKKMSKSKHNGVDPLDLVQTYGIDTTRLLTLADVSPIMDRNWTLDALLGIQNWQNRMWKAVQKFINLRANITMEELQQAPNDPKFKKDAAYMFDSRNFFLKAVDYHINQSQSFNTVICRMQGLTNSIYKVSDECIQKSVDFERLLAVHIILLAPMAPHLSSELWSGFCSAKHHLISNSEFDLKKDVLQQKWPTIDDNYLMKLEILVNNKSFKQNKMPYKELVALRSESAVQSLLQSDPKFTKTWDLDEAEIHYTLHTGCDGRLIIKCKKKAAEAEI